MPVSGEGGALAPTPPMGWNTWNTFGRDIDEQLIRETALAFADQGLDRAGYRYVVVDDVWQAPARVGGKLVPDPDRFGSGIASLAEFVHGRGLRFGIYSCAGTLTCEELPGSFGHEEADAATFAEWSVDYLKYDNCHVPDGADGPELFRRMGAALAASGRDIVYSVCEWGTHEPWRWARAAGAHLWRTTGDIFDTWDSIVEIGFDRQADLHPYAGPGGWNDPDMLVVGMNGRGNVARGGCTETEYRSHFSLWCLLAAPLMIGCDVRDMDAATGAIVLNEEAIAVNQDPLGRQARRVAATAGEERVEVWAKPLADGSVAVGLFNLGPRQRDIDVRWESLGLDPAQPGRVRDLWQRADVAQPTEGYAAAVDSHGVALVRIAPV